MEPVETPSFGGNAVKPSLSALVASALTTWAVLAGGTGLCADGSEPKPAGEASKAEGDKEEAKNWLIAVGINAYVDKRLPPLRFCENDARGVHEYFVKSGIVEPARAYLLVTTSPDEELRPLRRNLLQKLEHVLRYATEESFVAIYVASHGVTGRGADGEREGFFVPYDGNLDDLSATAFSLREIHERLRTARTERTLLLVDACRTPVIETRGADNPAQGSLFEQIRETKGHFFLASCSDSQVSFEMADAGHGAFTFFLLDGLTGKASNPLGQVTLEQLHTYVKNSLRDWADKNTKQVMEPFINIERWSGDPLILAYAPVTINLIVAPTPSPDDALWPTEQRTRIDGDKRRYPKVKTIADLDDYVRAGEWVDAYRAFKRSYSDARDALPPDDKDRERLFWLRHAALVLAYSHTSTLSVRGDYETLRPEAVDKIRAMRSIADAAIAREVLSHYETDPRAGNLFREYIKMIDDRMQE
jgi:hypothetical protein